MTTPPATPTHPDPSPITATLTAALEASRADLLAALDAVAEERLTEVTEGERESVADVAWHVGDREDWWRRWLRASVDGRAISAHVPRPRLPHVSSALLLREWLQQSRRPLVALIARLEPGGLDRPMPLPDGGEAAVTEVLGRLAAEERDAAAEVRRLAAALGVQASV